MARTRKWTSDDGSVVLYRGDCRDVLPTLPAGSVDAVVSDPPYGISNESYDGPHTPAFSAEFWGQALACCAPNAVCLSLASGRTYHRIASAIENAGWKIRQMWGWYFRDGLPISCWPREGWDRLVSALEPIVFATRGKVLLPLQREGPAWSRTGLQSTRTYSARSSHVPAQSASGHWPRSVLELLRTKGGTGKVAHPNAKPIALMEWMIRHLPSETICDPFMGSGSTGVACARMGRRFIGVELDAGHFRASVKRIKAALAKRDSQTTTLAAAA